MVAAAATACADPAFSVSVSLVAPRPSATAPPAKLTRAMTCKPAFRYCVGDTVQLEVSATKDCYVYLIDQDCRGTISPLLPYNDGLAAIGAGLADNRLRAGERRLVRGSARRACVCACAGG